MSIEEAYNDWSSIYDQNQNKTRDLDKAVTEDILSKYQFETVLEMGCGTGKNTVWLVSQANQVFSFDFSEGMLTIAKDKVQSENVQFQKADLTKEWSVQNEIADLVTFNLVLEHVEDLGFVFSQAYQKLRKGGKLFICELHPFKQYQGSKAKYETEMGIQTLDVFVHHTSEFVREAMENGFRLLELKEWFDQDNGLEIPRLISFVFEK